MDIVTRAQWGARAPRSRHTITTPTPELWFHHTAGNEAGPAGMRAIQAYHMDVRGWSDIGYSFVIDPAALVAYEGRGAGIAGGHTAGRNTISHAICVMGNYQTRTVSDALIDLIAQLVAHGHTQGWWPAQITGGHRQAPGASTACPGNNLQGAIPAINARAQGAPVAESHITQYQQHLFDRGYFELSVDGDFGPSTLATALDVSYWLDANIHARALEQQQAAARIAQLEGERDQAIARVVDLTDEVNGATDQIGALTAELEEAQARVEELEAAGGADNADLLDRLQRIADIAAGAG